MLFLNHNVFSQNQTYTICPGGLVKIKASDGSFGYRWDSDPTLTSTTVQDPTAMPAATTTYTVRSKATDGDNLVINGDFEFGNTGFTSEYTYYTQGTLKGQLEQGLYSVTHSGELANKYNIGFGSFGDHSGTGRMLIADGACGTNGVPAKATVWKQTITVDPNTDYIFSSWMTNVALNGISSSLRFSINGVVIGTPTSTLSQVGAWGQFYVTWNSGSATTAEIAIAEETGVCGGNDFAIDDISFNKVKEIVETIQVIVGPPTETPVITGDNSLCLTNTTTSLKSSISGGAWASSNTTVATVDASGKITPKTIGTTDITYTIGGTCGTKKSDPFVVTVTASSTTPVITGNNSLCLSGTINLNSSISGGTWTSSNTDVATIDASGQITPKTTGTTNITYATSSSCGNATSLPFGITVNAAPSTPVITGGNFLCLFGTINLNSSATGGTWASSNSAVATIDASGKVTPVSSGKTDITYTSSNTCGDVTSLPFEVTVGTTPEIPVVTGVNFLCLPNNITLISSANGGIWVSSDPSVATIDATGKITSVNAGKTNITYTVNSSCGNVTSLPFEVIVNSQPKLGEINGTTRLNVGQQSPLTINIPGGTWISADKTVVEIASNGTIKGLKNGESEITYILNTPCGVLVSSPFKITVLSDDLYLPNAFTPNGDGNNDEFRIYGSSIEKIEFSIFNQWGELVYKTTDLSKGWPGTYKGVEQPAGIYIYTAKLKMIDGEEVTKKGAVSLIR